MTAVIRIALALVMALVLAAPVRADEAPSHGGTAGPGGADAQALFQAANKLYFAGDWEGAVAAYAAIVERFEVEDPALYHNLGNACFRSGAYGSAILYYERARRLEPDAKLAEALDRNLDAARRTLQARYRSLSSTTLVYADPSGIAYRVTHLVGGDALAIGFAVLWAAVFGLLILRRVRPAARWPGRLVVPIGLLAALAGVLVWGRLATDADQRIGVVVSPNAMLRDGKHEVAHGRELPEGIEVKILDGDEAWAQVELGDGNRGWVSAKDLKQI